MNAPEPPDAERCRVVLVTHPFQTLAGQRLEFVKRRTNWSVDRVYVYDLASKLVSRPVEWTDLMAPDPFLVVADGRSPFHIDALVALVEAIDRLAQHLQDGPLVGGQPVGEPVALYRPTLDDKLVVAEPVGPPALAQGVAEAAHQ